jgi:hypothetical protein
MPTKSVPPSTGPRFFLILLAVAVAVIAREVVPRVIDRFALRVREEHRNQYNLLNGIRQDVQTLRNALNTINLRSNDILSNRLQNPEFDMFNFSVNNVAAWTNATDNYGRLLTVVESRWNNINVLLEYLRTGALTDIEELNTNIREIQESLQGLEPEIDYLRREVDRLMQPLLIPPPVPRKPLFKRK